MLPFKRLRKRVIAKSSMITYRIVCRTSTLRRPSIKCSGMIEMKTTPNLTVKYARHLSSSLPLLLSSLPLTYLSLPFATDLKSLVQTSISDLIEEISNLYRNIADQAIQHIHANEVIMTFGLSRTVEEFLKAAARKRKFEIIVAESAPSFTGQETAASMSKVGIETTLIPDSAIFAMMARVNKVIVGTHAVLANGGLIALSGTHALALAAKHHEVPFVVTVGLYKLSPLYPTYDQDSFNQLNPPSSILKFEEAVGEIEHVDVENPAFDYVPPELVSLFITNIGGHNPSYIYRLLAEYYHPADHNLF
ncbi:GCD complex subunit gcd7 [Balamuthia mandrillaris]